MVAVPTQTIDDAVSIESRLAGAATRLGEDRSKIDQHRLNVHRMREAGVLVDIDIHGFSQFTVKAGWLELGIPTGDARARRFTRGQKHLIPHEYVKKLGSLDSRFRACLKKYSVDITGYYPYRYVTYEAAPDWKAEMGRLEAELEALKADLAANYETIRADLATAYAEIAQEAWDALLSRRGGNPEVPLDLGEEKVFPDRDAFTEYVVARVLDRLPAAEEIANIRVECRYRMMVSQADVAEDTYIAEYWRAKAAEEHARTAFFDEQAEAQRRLVHEEEAVQRRLVLEQERTQRRIIQAEAEEKELEVRERRAALDAIKAEIVTQWRAQVADTIDPLVEAVIRRRAELHNSLANTLESIEKHGFLHGKVAEGLKNAVEIYRYYKALDPEGMLQVESLEEALERRLPHPDRKGVTVYDVDRIRGEVEQLVMFTADDARRALAGAEGTRAGALMI